MPAKKTTSKTTKVSKTGNQNAKKVGRVKYSGYVNIQLTEEQYNEINNGNATYQDFDNAERFKVVEHESGDFKTIKFKISKPNGDNGFVTSPNIQATKHIDKIVQYADSKIPIEVIVDVSEGIYQGRVYKRNKLLSVISSFDGIKEGDYLTKDELTELSNLMD